MHKHSRKYEDFLNSAHKGYQKRRNFYIRWTNTPGNMRIFLYLMHKHYRNTKTEILKTWEASLSAAWLAAGDEYVCPKC
jgi:hypothetical protein